MPKCARVIALNTQAEIFDSASALLFKIAFKPPLLHRLIQPEIMPLPQTEIYIKLELKYITTAIYSFLSPYFGNVSLVIDA